MNKLYTLILFSLVSCSHQPNQPNVHIAGAMRNVMMMGKLEGTIQLDTISDKAHVYGLGPLAYLKGEILILDGHSYVATIQSDSIMTVKEDFNIEAPFFVYTHVPHWREIRLPDSVQNLKQLDSYLDQSIDENSKPLAFRLSGKVKKASIHVVNLPEGSIVQSPSDAHKGQQTFSFSDQEVNIIGFFSRKHKTIFTHHDSFIHTHLITTDKKVMGHLDEAHFSAEMKFYLPQ